jgi:Holliday junction resolvase RusA-like endonuclease
MIRTPEIIEAINQLFGRNHRVFLDPVPQARHRNNGNRAFDPNVIQKAAVRFAIKQYLNETSGITEEMFPLTRSYVSVELTFFINRPRCHFVNGDRSCDVRARYQNIMPTTSGDIDNYCKFFLDAIDGVFFSNDRNVVQIKATKLYCNGNGGRTIFNIRPYKVNTINLTVDEENEGNSENQNGI